MSCPERTPALLPIASEYVIRRSGLQCGEAAARGISDTSVCERPTASDVNMCGEDIIQCSISV